MKACFLTLVATWALLTAQRVGVWQSDLTLWTATVQTAPALPIAHLNLCAAFAHRGHLEAAFAACQRAVGLTFDPHRSPLRAASERLAAEATTALILAEAGHLTEARAMLTDLHTRWPDDAVVTSYLAAVSR